jgi:hypothetical protein
MSLTGNNDLYVSLSDALISTFISAIKAQRPSLLNYVSPYFAAHPEDCCIQVPHPANGSPAFSQLPPIGYSPIPEAPPIDFCVQITDVAIGFGADIGLPTSLLPLPQQRIAAKFAFSARFRVPRLNVNSIGCPSAGDPLANATFHFDLCDPFDAAFATTIATDFRQCGKVIFISFAMDRFDTTVVSPGGLTQTVDRMIALVLDTKILPSMWPSISPYVIDLSKYADTGPIKTITITPSVPQTLPDPDIQNHLLQARLDLQVTSP